MTNKCICYLRKLNTISISPSLNSSPVCGNAGPGLRCINGKFIFGNTNSRIK